MGLYTSENCPPPVGMATSNNRASLKKNQCQRMVGLLPARSGQQRLAAVPKYLLNFPGPILGQMVWYGQDNRYDTLLILTEGQEASGDQTKDLYTTRLYYETGTTAAWDYDEIDGMQRSRLRVTAPAAITGSNICALNVRNLINDWTQFKRELIFSVEGTLYRYYRDETTSAETLALVGVATPGVPTLTAQNTGSMTANSTYSYITTAVDELQREGSPSTAVSVTLAGAQQRVKVDLGSLTVGGLTGITYWNIYRLNPGSSTYLFVTQVAIGTVTYTDSASDASIAQNAAAPSPGENDKPNLAKIMTVWKDRLVLDDQSNNGYIQVSNAGSPTQFSSLSLPTNVADGFRAWAQGRGDNDITGLANLGSMLAIFKRSSMSFLEGDSIENFALLPIHERGCANPSSVRRCENEIIFLSQDGPYSVLYENGYVLRKLSTDVDDQFSGFIATAREDTPTDIGRPVSIEVVMSKEGNVTSFYSRNRYYLSIIDRTLCYDMYGRGWSDTGWGFLPSALVYQAQFARATAGFPVDSAGMPEAVFLTKGTIYSNRPDSDGTHAPTNTSLIHDLFYFTAADTPFDPDAELPDGVKVYASIWTRPYDGDGPPQNRRKRAKRFIQYGRTSVKPGRRIGWITPYVGDRQAGPRYPILRGTRLSKENALFEQQWTGEVTGEEIWYLIEYTITDLHLENSIAEYIFTS